MKLSPNTTPVEPDNLLIRMHNQVGAAVDVTGSDFGSASRWDCHGCGAHSERPVRDILCFIRRGANEHAGTCRGSYHRLK
ncbi:hypothetical protein GCM10020367_31040 [Streptomyces sannanensis]|uniref:Uncharacterized protein n=1 Tax=Streptomyces sannanensis TaxID=285536 RepID=A0ABP6SC82_9ACTN